MLQRFTQVGEFYVMSKPSIPPKITQMGWMDILIYDEESDRHVKITYRQALIATGAFTVAVNGDVRVRGPFLGDTVMTGGMTLTEYAAAAEVLCKANEIVVADANAVAAIVAAVDAPVVLARPFIEHAMLSAVLAVSGSDTGATIFGPSDMQARVRNDRHTNDKRHIHIHTCCITCDSHAKRHSIPELTQISANTSVKTIEGVLLPICELEQHKHISIALRTSSNTRLTFGMSCQDTTPDISKRSCTSHKTCT